MSQQLPDNIAEALESAIDSDALLQVRNFLKHLSAVEIALLLESSPPSERTLLWQLLDPELEAEVLSKLTEEVQEQIALQMDSSELASLTESMDEDDIADVLQQLPERLTQEVLELMSIQDRKRVETVLTYPEDTAGGLMDTNTITVRPELSVDTVLRYLRRHERLPDTTDSLFVVDRSNRYLGRVYLNNLLTAQPTDLVNSYIKDTDIAIDVNINDADVASLFERNDWVSAPVVNASKELLGRITIDDAVDVMKEEAERSLMGMAGLSEDEDTFATIKRSMFRRALWLGINLVTALLAASVIGQFQATIERVVALAVLMPIVASMGGIGGTQTMTIMIRGIALGHIQSNNLKWLLRREIVLSALNSLIWAVVCGSIAAWWFNDVRIAIILAIAISCNLLAGAITGTLLPVFIKRLNIDPAIASGVVLTTITDVVGFLSFLGLAFIYYG